MESTETDKSKVKVRLRTERGKLPPLVAIGQDVHPLHDLYHYILTQSWGAYFALVVMLFLLINALFALGYYFFGGVSNARPGSFEDAFFFSVQTLATIGYGGMFPVSRIAHVLVSVEAFCGMLGVALATGVTFARFARPSARVLFSERIAVGPRDGVPTMHFRMANWRHNQVVEAQARIIVLRTVRTKEGDVHRIPVELKLVRDRTAMFLLTWTMMHVIEPGSPFYGEGALDRLREEGAELYLNVIGQDETFAQTIHARYRYQLDDIAWNTRFHDVLSTLPDGGRVIDYRYFHDVVPLLEPSDDPNPAPSTLPG